ncbi:MAG: FAD:protein FMN transferase [Rhodoferax sp.]
MGRWRSLRLDFTAMASPCCVLIDARDERQARRAVHAAITEVRRIEAKFSRYRPDSIISRINAAAGQAPVPIDEETALLLDFADAMYVQSDGLFDVTSGVLRHVWDFKRGVLPSPQALEQVLSRVGWPRVQRSAGQVFLPQPGMELDFGGFGKEYAADRAAAVLLQHGMTHALVNLGGDLHALGPRGLPECAGQPWRINIAHPRPDAQTSAKPLAVLELSRGGLATSGDYERFFERDGQRYCHVLDPRSGWPVSYWQSVSVLAANATSAGAASTIAMLKRDQALPWLHTQGLRYLGRCHEGRVWQS